MKSPLISPQILEEKPYFFEEPTLLFSEYSEDHEGNKDKIQGLLNNGPFDKNTRRRDFEGVNFIPVVGKGDVDSLEEILKHIENNIWAQNGKKYGFNDIFDCDFNVLDKDRWYTVPKYNRDIFEEVGHKVIHNHNFRDNETRNIVIFSTSSSSDSPKNPNQSEYYGMKSSLVRGFLPSQSLSSKYQGLIYKEKKDGYDVSKYDLMNLACQIYAKVGGIPWTMRQPNEMENAEINIGLRATVPKTGEGNYVYGIAQIFSKYGKWIDSVVEVEEGVTETSYSYALSKESMLNLLENCIQKYKNKILVDSPVDNVSAINVQKLNGYDDSEIQASAEVARKEGVEIQLVDITDSKIRLFRNTTNDVKNTRRGYFKKINPKTGILCTTGDYETSRGLQKHKIGTPIPLVVKTIEHDDLVNKKIERVAQNIFHLTRLNWDDAVNVEISKPVTLNYAQRVSRMAGNGISVEMVNEDVPWFL